MRSRSLLPVGPVLFGLVFLLWLTSLVMLWVLPGLARWSVGLLYIIYDTWLILYVARELRGQAAKAARTAGLAAGRPRVAVLIAARNEASALPATLDALLRSEEPAEEIWLIDDGSTDETRALLAARYDLDLAELDVPAYSAAHPSLRGLAKKNSGKADSLNRALSLTTADLIVTLDADTLVRSDAVNEMRKVFAEAPLLVAAGGVLTPQCGPGASARVFEWFQTFEYLRAFIARVAWMRVNALLLVSGAFACYRRDALARVGGFDPRSWVEDYELTHRLHRYSHDHGMGWRIGVLSEAVAATDAPATLGAFLRQRRRWFAGFLQTLFQYRDMVANPAYSTVGRIMLPLKVIDTLQPLFGITAFILLVDFAWRREAVLAPVLAVIAIKLVIDFCFLLWGVSFYNRWKRQRSSPRQWVLAGLAALTEPFCFQLMRHTGAMFGWFAVLTRRVNWMPQRGVARLAPRYTRLAIFLHWTMALFLVFNIGLAWSVDYLPDSAVRPVIDVHKSIGITLLGLILMRILWRVSHPPPPLTLRYSAWERRGAHGAHLLLYGLMLALPLSGWLHDSAWKDAATHPMRLFGLIPWPRISLITALEPATKERLHAVFGQIHGWFADALVTLFVVHVLGALKHQWVDREPELQRILPRSGRDGA